MSRRRPEVLLAEIALSACATVGEDPSESGAGRSLLDAPAASARDEVLAWVAGEPLRASEVFERLRLFYPTETLSALDEVVLDRLVALECARLGVSVSEEEVAREAERRLVRLAEGAEGLERFFGGAGIPAEEGRRRLREIVGRERAVAYLVRFERIREGSVEAQRLAFPDRVSAEQAAERLRRGADFLLLALAEDPRALETGGVGPVEYGTLPASVRERLAALEEGAMTEVLDLGPGARSRFAIFRVSGRRSPRRVPFEEVREAIAAGLREHPLAPAEYLEWFRALSHRYGVRNLLVEEGGGISPRPAGLPLPWN